jgi:hypothetical protein
MNCTGCTGPGYQDNDSVHQQTPVHHLYLQVMLFEKNIYRNICIQTDQTMRGMQDLSVDRIIATHGRIIARDGGDGRLLSEGNLHQLTFRANLIPSEVPRAAFAFYSLIAYPAFREGNEKTAQELAAGILIDGGYSIDPTDEEALVRLGKDILGFTAELEDAEAWYRSHTKKRT